jgi:hypothetical protein
MTPSIITTITPIAFTARTACMGVWGGGRKSFPTVHGRMAVDEMFKIML